MFAVGLQLSWNERLILEANILEKKHKILHLILHDINVEHYLNVSKNSIVFIFVSQSLPQIGD